ncbi:PX-domain-containing protein [Patellaria atrata CBS 101060]|uniref:Endosomal/vacuolar adapter protein YPT35 n=1 Tax=Patellaria atrata CBS 101060 TaxID=1346257 RepID=A0A9P4S3B6_9PEZI|nr:PX-domain-containing protein [Patellaria atrata CBS 101060]
METSDSGLQQPPNENGLSSSPHHGRGKASADGQQRHSITPPFWQSHQRNDSTFSHASYENRTSNPIRLEDHTDDTSEQTKACWARHVTIDDYVIISGNAPGVGAYVVWNCTVETLDGGPLKIRKRYSEFDRLRSNLIKTFPHATGSLPPLPPKSVISRFRPRFLERRKSGLFYFLNCVLLNPEFAGSPVLKEFLFS